MTPGEINCFAIESRRVRIVEQYLRDVGCIDVEPYLIKDRARVSSDPPGRVIQIAALLIASAQIRLARLIDKVTRADDDLHVICRQTCKSGLSRLVSILLAQ